MTKSQIDIAQFLCSRLCHDIIAPVGAINSGLELLSDMPSGDNSEIIDLINKGGQSAAAKLTLFRFAFGASSAGHINSAQDINPLIDQIFDADKFEINTDLSSLNTENLTKRAKLILQLTMIVADAAPYGGKISIIAIEPNCVAIKLISNKIIDNQNNFDIMNIGCEHYDLSPRNIVPYMIFINSKELQASISKKSADGEMTYKLAF